MAGHSINVGTNFLETPYGMQTEHPLAPDLSVKETPGQVAQRTSLYYCDTLQQSTAIAPIKLAAPTTEEVNMSTAAATAMTPTAVFFSGKNTPQLEKPIKLTEEELQQLNTAITQLVTPSGNNQTRSSHDREAIFFRMMIACMQRHIKANEDTSLLINDHVLHRHNENKTHQKEYHETHDAQIKNSRYAAFLWWVNAGTTTSCGIGAICLLFSGVGVAGALGALSITSGVTSFLKVDKDKRSKKLTGVLFELKEKRNGNKREIKNNMQEAQQAAKAILNHWATLRECNNHRRNSLRLS